MFGWIRKLYQVEKELSKEEPLAHPTFYNTISREFVINEIGKLFMENYLDGKSRKLLEKAFKIKVSYSRYNSLELYLNGNTVMFLLQDRVFEECPTWEKPLSTEYLKDFLEYSVPAVELVKEKQDIRYKKYKIEEEKILEEEQKKLLEREYKERKCMQEFIKNKNVLSLGMG